MPLPCTGELNVVADLEKLFNGLGGSVAPRGPPMKVEFQVLLEILPVAIVHSVFRFPLTPAEVQRVPRRKQEQAFC